jgi:hypothetical protein
VRVGGLADAIACVVGWFKDRGAPFCLVGGLAVSFRTIERATRDVDLVVAVASDQDADECVRELREIGFAAVEIFQRKESGAVSTVRMLSSSFPGIYVDLLFFACGIEREIVESATEIEILPGVIVPTATMSSLIAMKVLSSGNKRRRQDLLDLEHLIADASQAEILESQKLVSLITARGFNSGRDLEKVLKDLLADMS